MQNREQAEQCMFNHIEQWKQSNLSQKQYCEQYEITYHSFHYWLRRYKRKHNEQRGAFVQLQIQSELACTELLLTDGRRLVFHQPVSSSFLKQLIS